MLLFFHQPRGGGICDDWTIVTVRRWHIPSGNTRGGRVLDAGNSHKPDDIGDFPFGLSVPGRVELRIAAAIGRADLSLPARLVLVHLELTAGDTRRCTITTDDIARHVGIARLTVLHAMQRLTRLGVITRAPAARKPSLIVLTGDPAQGDVA